MEAYSRHLQREHSYREAVEDGRAGEWQRKQSLNRYHSAQMGGRRARRAATRDRYAAAAPSASHVSAAYLAHATGSTAAQSKSSPSLTTSSHGSLGRAGRAVAVSSRGATGSHGGRAAGRPAQASTGAGSGYGAYTRGVDMTGTATGRDAGASRSSTEGGYSGAAAAAGAVRPGFVSYGGYGSRHGLAESTGTRHGRAGSGYHSRTRPVAGATAVVAAPASGQGWGAAATATRTARRDRAGAGAAGAQSHHARTSTSTSTTATSVSSVSTSASSQARPGSYVASSQAMPSRSGYSSSPRRPPRAPVSHAAAARTRATRSNAVSKRYGGFGASDSDDTDTDDPLLAMVSAAEQDDGFDSAAAYASHSLSTSLSSSSARYQVARTYSNAADASNGRSYGSSSEVLGSYAGSTSDAAGGTGATTTSTHRRVRAAHGVGGSVTATNRISRVADDDRRWSPAYQARPGGSPPKRKPGGTGMGKILKSASQRPGTVKIKTTARGESKVRWGDATAIGEASVPIDAYDDAADDDGYAESRQGRGLTRTKRDNPHAGIEELVVQLIDNMAHVNPTVKHIMALSHIALESNTVRDRIRTAARTPAQLEEAERHELLTAAAACTHVGRAGGVNAVLMAMRHYQYNRKVTLRGLWALEQFLEDAENRTAFLVRDGRDVLERAKFNFKRDKDIARSLSVLSRLPGIGSGRSVCVTSCLPRPKRGPKVASCGDVEVETHSAGCCVIM